MNARAERLGRAILESFVDDHEELLFADHALSNPTLADELVVTNAGRPITSSARHLRHPFSSNIQPRPKALRRLDRRKKRVKITACKGCGVEQSGSSSGS
jgi:hypothetical protein